MEKGMSQIASTWRISMAFLEPPSIPPPSLLFSPHCCGGPGNDHDKGHGAATPLFSFFFLGSCLDISGYSAETDAGNVTFSSFPPPFFTFSVLPLAIQRPQRGITKLHGPRGHSPPSFFPFLRQRATREPCVPFFDTPLNYTPTGGGKDAGGRKPCPPRPSPAQAR